jgi:hypothetical protein
MTCILYQAYHQYWTTHAVTFITLKSTHFPLITAGSRCVIVVCALFGQQYQYRHLVVLFCLSVFSFQPRKYFRQRRQAVCCRLFLCPGKVIQVVHVVMKVELGLVAAPESSESKSAEASSAWRELRAQVQFLDDECRGLRRKASRKQRLFHNSTCLQQHVNVNIFLLTFYVPLSFCYL